MVRNPTRGWGSVALIGAIALTATPGGAGAEPLFRHAFEQWPAENYQVMVFHHEPVQDEARKFIELLSAAPLNAGANVSFAVIDVTEPMDEPMQTLWYTQTGVEPPWIVVTAPGAGETTPPVWAGSLRAETVRALLDSPARRKIAAGLIGGDAAVWVLLECGEAIRDEAAVDLLAAELKRQELKLSSRASRTNAPAPAALAPVTGGYSLVRVTRNDSAEEFFVTNLLHGSPPSHVKPMAFAVYGRGRVLPALVGKRLNAESIASTCAFIAGACTNKSKTASPGYDLLLSVHWNAPTEPANSVPQVSSPVVASSAEPSNPPAIAPNPQLGTNSSLTIPAPSNAGSINVGSHLGIGLLIVVFTGLIGFVVLRSRRG
jgi:hypothetical protein